MNIFVCLEIPPSMQPSMRSACKEPARKVRIVIADMPEVKEKQNLHLRHKRHNHQQSASGNGSNRHASISRAGPPYQLRPRRGSDTLTQPRSESQPRRQRTYWRCEQSIGKSLHRAEPISVLTPMQPLFDACRAHQRFSRMQGRSPRLGAKLRCAPNCDLSVLTPSSIPPDVGSKRLP